MAWRPVPPVPIQGVVTVLARTQEEERRGAALSEALATWGTRV